MTYTEVQKNPIISFYKMREILILFLNSCFIFLCIGKKNMCNYSKYNQVISHGFTIIVVTGYFEREKIPQNTGRAVQQSNQIPS